MSFKNLLQTNEFFDAYAHYIKQGGEFELIDGDNNQIMDRSLKALFSKIHPNESEKKECFVVSIIGPQSTGKSTLLNFLFNTSFQMSAGRCTQGLYASYFKTDFPNAQDCLVLDSEGLLSIERNDEKFDKKLTILAMAISQVMIINVNGELNEAMKKIISISLFAAKQLRLCTNKKPIIFFVLRNMTDTDKKKQVQMIDKIREEFEEVAKLSKVNFRDIFDYRESDSFELMYSAYNKDEVGDKLFNICIVNASFRNSCEALRHKIFNEAGNGKSLPFNNLHEFLKTTRDVWQCVSTYNDILKLSSIKEINDRNELTEIVKEISQKHIDSNDSKNESTIAKKIEIIIKNGQDTVKVKKDIENCRTEYEESIQEEFDRITGSRYSKELKTEYKNLLFKRIENIAINGREEWDLRAYSRESQLEAEQIFDQIEKFMINQTKEFQSANNGNDIESKVKAYIKQFEEKFQSVGAEYNEKLTKKRKTEEEIQNRVYDMMTGVCNTQRIEERFLEVGTSKKCRSETNILKTKAIFDVSENNDIIEYEQHFYNTKIDEAGKESKVLSAEKILNPKEKPKSSVQIITESINKRLGVIADFLNPGHAPAKEKKKQTAGQILKTTPMINPKTQAAIDELNEDLCSMRHTLNNAIKVDLKKELEFLASSANLNNHLVRTAVQGISYSLQQFEQKVLNNNHMKLNVELMRSIITDYLFREFARKLNEEEENSHKNAIDEYYSKEKELKSTFERKLRATLGDEQMAKNHFHQIVKLLGQSLVQQCAKDFVASVRTSTKFHPDDFAHKVNKVIENDSEEKIFKWATDIIGFMKDEFRSDFNGVRDQSAKMSNSKYLNNLDNFYQKLIERIKNFEAAVVYIESPQNNDAECYSLFFKLFKSFMTGKVNDFKSYIDQLKSKNVIFKKDMRDYMTSDSPFTEEMLFDQTNKDDIIHNLSSYTKFLLICFELKREVLKEYSFDYKKHSLNEIDLILSQNLEESLGCQHKCPYCGAKCTQIANHQGHHRARRHRTMGFNGCWQLKEDRTSKELLTEICDSSENINEAKWKDATSQFHEKDSKDAQKDNSLREKLIKHGATIGKLNFSLEWFDPNDLDLYVICPCNTSVYFGNKKCNSCTAELDVDMNLSSPYDAYKPVEHVLLSTAKSGTYNISVRMYRGKKSYQGRTGGDSSQFVLKVNGENMATLVKYDGIVTEGESKTYQFSYQPGVSFNTHCDRHYPDWKITVGDVIDTTFNQYCLTAFEKIKRRLTIHYGL